MKWAWFSQSENSADRCNGQKGDQTGWESKVASPYDFGQTRVIRAKDRRLAHAIARVQRYWCEGTSNGGYGQNDRLSLEQQLEKVGITHYKKVGKFNADCSSSTSAAVNVAFALLGKSTRISWSCVTWNIEDALLQTECFNSFPYTKPEHLLRGDIVLAPSHHVVVCVTSGSEPSNTNKYVAKSRRNFRKAPDTSSKKFGKIPKGTTVKGYPYGTHWIYVHYNGHWGYIMRKSATTKKVFMEEK